MIISNDEGILRKTSSRKYIMPKERITPLPGASATPVAPAKSPSDHFPAVISCFTALSAQLGFYIMPRRSLSSSALNHNMASLSEQYSGFSCDLNSIMIFLTSRSDEYGRPLGAEESKSQTSVAKYLKHFSHSKCQSLIGKPKIFILLLRVTVRDPKAPKVRAPDDKKNSDGIKQHSSSTSNIFQPEAVNLSEYGEDILLVRIMHQNAGGVEAAPTFGGTNMAHNDKLPWYLQILIGALMEQGCYKDILSILGYVKEEIAFGPKARSSPTPKPEDVDEVEMFIDHSLKKKLYLMPGI